MPKFQPNIPRLREAVQEVFEANHMPGLGLGVVSGGQLIYAEGFGHADIALGKEYTPDTGLRLQQIVDMYRNPELEPWQ